MKKRLFYIAVALSMALSLFAGCSGTSGQPQFTGGSASTGSSAIGDKGSETQPAVNFDEEPYEINFLYWVSMEGSNQQKVAQAVNDLALEEINMTVNLIPMTLGTYDNQISLMLAANETLDLFPVWSRHFSNYIDSQYVVNCADYLDYAQDIVRILGSDAYTGYIGDFLIGFSGMKERAFPAGLVVRKDIFDELGYKVSDFSVTIDDYSTFGQITRLFEAVKAKYPSMNCLDGTSIMGRQTGSYIDTMGSYFGVLEDYGKTLTVTNWFESDQYKQFCLIAREWYTKGYSSADIAVNKDSGEIKMKAGNCFSFITNVKPNTNIEKQAQTGYEVEVIRLSEGMKSTNTVNTNVYSVANASKNPAKAMQFLNWTYISREFEDLINWGIKGEDWLLTDEGLAAYPDGVDISNVGYHNDFGWCYPNQFAGTPWTGNPTDIWDQYKEYNDNLLVSQAYGFTFNSTPVSTEEALLNAVFEQYNYDLAFGAVDIESGLAKFNEALYAAGLQDVIDEKQNQLNEWLAAG